ncbi:membrane protein [Streptomyces aureoverticillatus]|nr:membrane protein [Streptomyces aureoverticillatus]
MTTATAPAASTAKAPNPAPARRAGARTAWLAAALFWTAFAILEGVNHGWLAGTFALAFLIAPDLTFLAGLRDAPRTAHGQLPPRAVPYYNAAHRATVPLGLMALYTVVPLTWPPILAALCGWLAHISYDRALGYGLRTKDGFQRD